MSEKNIIKDNVSGRTFEVNYKNHKDNVEAYTWVDGDKVIKFGTDAETAFWALEQAIYQKLHFRIDSRKSGR